MSTNYTEKFQMDDGNIDIIVQIDDPPSKHVSVSLNPGEKLSKIREKLEQNSKVKMNDTLSFANKIVQTNNYNNEIYLAEVAKEDEEKKTLEKIVDKKDKILYLKSEP